MDEKRRQVTIKMTKEQEEAVKAFFAHNDWDYDSEVTTKKRRSNNTDDDNEPSRTSEDEGEIQREDDIPEEYMGEPIGDDTCPFCYLQPCITSSNAEAPWIGPGQPPSEHNSGIRKTLYKRFWMCINNIGGWNIPRYVHKKRQLGGNENTVYHQREIMPDCVLNFCRQKYPNPKGVAYMGHKWY